MKGIRHENIVGLHEVIDDETCSLLFLVLHLIEYGPIVDPKVRGYGLWIGPLS